jgi:hypothetical protein
MKVKVHTHHFATWQALHLFEDITLHFSIEEIANVRDSLLRCHIREMARQHVFCDVAESSPPLIHLLLSLC